MLQCFILLSSFKFFTFYVFQPSQLPFGIAAGILFPFTGMLLNPIIAGAAMALSSVTVVSNANRLKWFKPSTFRGDV